MKFISKKFAISLAISMLLFNPTIANENYNEFDTIRAELSFLKDKNSPQYVKTKQKLEKIISKNKIDYSTYARFADVQRLISEQKYNSAIYELNSLIDEGFEISNCNMLLGDIALKLDKPPKKIAHYYKLALQYDRFNFYASYRLAKLYLREKRNVLAIENLKSTIENTTDSALLADVENLIKNKITPQNGYEANNLYEALGNIYEKTGNLEAAYEAYSKAIQINKKDIYLKYHLANLLY
ncbi:MAG: tetratricopeptide repeat protein, partial [Candidatus Gastranaerophilales bacterium]|nr:tetratricopeptide repeat protein [Candidatus Gastranaerophilales bacterium]